LLSASGATVDVMLFPFVFGSWVVRLSLSRPAAGSIAQTPALWPLWHEAADALPKAARQQRGGAARGAMQVVLNGLALEGAGLAVGAGPIDQRHRHPFACEAWEVQQARPCAPSE